MASRPCFFISLASVSVPLLSIQVITMSTPWSFIRDTSVLRSLTPKDRLVSRKSIFADGYLSNDAWMPLEQSADCGDWYDSSPTFLAFTCLASHGKGWPGHVKHRYEPFSPKRLGGPGAWSEPHSALMFHPNVGTPAWPSRSAPVTSNAATGSTANTSSSDTRAWTS